MADEQKLQEQMKVAQANIDAWHQGQTSEHYESGGRGPGVISSGVGDHGGMSYGSYQLSKSTVETYVRESNYAKEFENLSAGSSAFNDKWKAIAKRDPDGFKQDQHEFIARTHLAPQVDSLRDAGIDLSGRGKAVQDAVWSTAVQFRNMTSNLFANGLREKFGEHYTLSNLSDKDVIEAVQDYKIAHNESLFRKSSEAVRAGTLNRAGHEKTDLLRLAAAEYTVAHGGQKPDWAPAERVVHSRILHQGQHGEDVKKLQSNLNELGVRDAKDQPLTVKVTFDHATTEAVKRFQHDHGLKEDERIGPETLKMIDGQVEDNAPHTFLPAKHDIDHPSSEVDLLAQHHNPAIAAFHDRVQNEPTMAGYSETERSRVAAAACVECQKTGKNLAGMTEVESYDANGRAVFTADDPAKAARNPYTSSATVDIAKAVETPVQDSLNQMQTIQMTQAQAQEQAQTRVASGPVIS